jgi:hypothetical protein
MEGKCKNVMELTSCLDAIMTMNDLCLSKSVFDWASITRNHLISTLFEEYLDSPLPQEQRLKYHINSIVFSEKKAKNQLLTTILYQALRPVYCDIDGSEGYSLDPLDLPHIEILFFDNSGDFCFETLKNLINKDLADIFKDNKAIKHLEVLDLTCKVLDKVVVQPSYTLKEFEFNIKKCSIYMKRHPAIRLVLVDAMNTFFQTDVSNFTNCMNSSEPPKKKPMKSSALEAKIIQDLVKITQVNDVKLLFTAMEYYTKKAIKLEGGSLVMEEQVNKYLSYLSNDQMNIGVSALYLINPSMHGDIMKKYLISIDVEEEEEPGKDPDCILAINKRNNVHEYTARAIKIENCEPSFTQAKKVLIKGALMASYMDNDGV